MNEDFFTLSTSEKDPVCFVLSGITYKDPGYHIKRKKSEVYVIEYILDGNGTLETMGNKYTPAKGDSYFLRKGVGQEYSSSGDDPWEKIWVNITGELPDMFAKRFEIDTFYEKLDIRAELEKVINIAKCGGDTAEASAAVYKILYKMYERSAKTVNNKYIKDVKKFIDINIAKKITSDDLAEYADRSKSQVNKEFKKEYGISPYEYILDGKISLAKSLLENTTLSIGQIAYKLSFSDGYYFSSVFKKRVGLSPKFFRNGKEK